MELIAVRLTSPALGTSTPDHMPCRVTGKGYMDVNRISGYIPGKMVFFLMQVSLGWSPHVLLACVILFHSGSCPSFLLAEDMFAVLHLHFLIYIASFCCTCYIIIV